MNKLYLHFIIFKVMLIVESLLSICTLYEILYVIKSWIFLNNKGKNLKIELKSHFISAGFYKLFMFSSVIYQHFTKRLTVTSKFIPCFILNIISFYLRFYIEFHPIPFLGSSITSFLYFIPYLQSFFI